MVDHAKCHRTENNNEEVQTTGRALQSFPKKPEVHLSFESLTYTVNTYINLKKVKKEILHGIGGSFRSGQLTAVMGPSGCGKSTLLNVLAGYSISGSSGKVYLNDSLRDKNQMANISCYIQQDDYVRDLLTVRESMTIAAHLKLPTTVSAKSKASQVEDLLDALGLSIHGDTVTKRLSGGQKKRLSIALELITNPSILFLDEPTSGLDSQSCSQFVSLMAELAHNQSRTMVCTLHQPSALLFEKFDQVYALSSGRCIYQGPPSSVIPYFAERLVVCPPYHNPADFLIEVAIGEYGTDVLVGLFDTTKITNTNGRNGYHTICDEDHEEIELEIRQEDNNTNDEQSLYKTELLKKPPFYVQIYHLYFRNVTMYKRNKTNLLLRIAAHLAVALIMSYMYLGVGNDAAQVLANMKFVYGSNLFLVYTGLMAVIVSYVCVRWTSICGATIRVRVRDKVSGHTLHVCVAPPFQFHQGVISEYLVFAVRPRQGRFTVLRRDVLPLQKSSEVSHRNGIRPSEHLFRIFLLMLLFAVHLRADNNCHMVQTEQTLDLTQNDQTCNRIDEVLYLSKMWFFF
ncbi:ATP-binding cassette sub-family G member 1 isoform X2 [Acyrthosiphon pisum]|uniref:ABC transporter domain-containing protein n=1 Tax=Acyrthosiphon pisum TaxID=7029 RepID=A0A8R2D584_ACYPI|nr:ATP-binding cassette sub-family G member 1 isoform X2 [Acyrthosiphon pisum]|eukprot:XP_016662000.1 PREDICTED: ATP-binding cassette sub-family G member 1 isoform X2 [Acyrthosiphon pisum]